MSVYPNTIREAVLLCSFFLLLFLPPFLYVSLNLSSMTTGLAVSVVIITLFFYHQLLALKVTELNAKYLIVALPFALHFMSFVLFDFEEKKLLALLLTVTMLAAAAVFSKEIIIFNNDAIVRIVTFLLVMVLLLGFGSFVIDFGYLNYDNYVKSIFPFSEPSHYAIGVSSIFFVAGFLVSNKLRLIILSSVIFIGIFLPSIILLSLSALMIFTYYVIPFKLKTTAFMVAACIAGLMAINATTETDLSYFSDRIPFIYDPGTFIYDKNDLTALVYMQGWEEIGKSIVETKGLGVGILNMDETKPGYYGELIFSIVGEYKNRGDGGFLASKIVSEFGVIGVYILLIYCLYLSKSIKYFYRLNRRWHSEARKSSPVNEPVYLLFAHSIIVTSVIEIFLRGTSYFTSGMFLLITAIFIVEAKHHKVDDLHINRSLDSTCP